MCYGRIAQTNIEEAEEMSTVTSLSEITSFHRISIALDQIRSDMESLQSDLQFERDRAVKAEQRVRDLEEMLAIEKDRRC